MYKEFNRSIILIIQLKYFSLLVVFNDLDILTALQLNEQKMKWNGMTCAIPLCQCGDRFKQLQINASLIFIARN